MWVGDVGMRNDEHEDLERVLGIGGIREILKNTNVTKGILGNNIATAAFTNPKEVKNSVKDIIDQENSGTEHNFVAYECEICGKEMDNLYSWYDLEHDEDDNRSVAVCSIKCLDDFRKNHNTNDYQIIEHNRCSAYFECEEINNLRGKCERVENKSYRETIGTFMYNFCEPAQAGIILSTHKMTGVLKDFSKQTEKQYLSNKEMMEQGAEESTKQFKITTWMTVLVIFLTILNFVPMFFNVGSSDYSEQLREIESTLNEIRPTKELSQIGTKLDEVSGLISSNTSSSDQKIIELLEIIKQELKSITDPQK